MLHDNNGPAQSRLHAQLLLNVGVTTLLFTAHQFDSAETWSHPWTCWYLSLNRFARRERIIASDTNAEQPAALVLVALPHSCCLHDRKIHIITRHGYHSYFIHMETAII
jgi:hypothetical protein